MRTDGRWNEAQVGLRSPVQGPVTAAGAALGAVFGAVARLRGSRPLHPQGVTYAATVRRDGGGHSGVPWFDEPGSTKVSVRVSRAIGLPPWLPDVYGVALRVPLAQPPAGEPWADLLFASTGDTAYGRFVLRLRSSLVGGPLTTLLPVRAPAGPLLLRLTPDAHAGRHTPRAMRLAYAVGTGPWTDVASVHVHGELGTGASSARHDPVAHPLPGTRQYGWVVRLREPAYRAARAAQPRA